MRKKYLFHLMSLSVPYYPKSLNGCEFISTLGHWVSADFCFGGDPGGDQGTIACLLPS